MKAVSSARAAPLAHLCQQLGQRPVSTFGPSRLSPLIQATCLPSSRNTRSIRTASCKRLRRSQPAFDQPQPRQLRPFATETSTLSTPEEGPFLSAEHLTTLHDTVERLATAILHHPGVPDEELISNALAEYQKAAQTLLAGKMPPSHPIKQPVGSTATSALLSSVEKQHSPTAVTKTDLLRSISDRAFDIIQHDPVFITAPILKSYVQLQSTLGRPESFPTVFDLYRFKPVPRPTKSQPIQYTKQNPDKPAAAVPTDIADIAINAAITVRDLPLTLATIDTTYCTTAYKRSKFLRSALFPIAGLALTPPAAYTLATQFSDWQTTMDSQTATQIAMAGILTYTSAVATVGYVALTTANDQMVRVTWATGLPLWERWVREEERRAIDKVSQAWGFKSRDKWGDEEGEEWDSLREWIGLRGMTLDRVELMDGME